MLAKCTINWHDTFSNLTLAQPDNVAFVYKHTDTPLFSSQQYNPMVDSNTCPDGPVSYRYVS